MLNLEQFFPRNTAEIKDKMRKAMGRKLVCTNSETTMNKLQEQLFLFVCVTHNPCMQCQKSNCDPEDSRHLRASTLASVEAQAKQLACTEAV